ncbi:hypothetical protein [Romboutsia sp.]|uniref:hypothetical protein n=1 Tax=Romboutsia sp. TaxID=1965302 RepID=UPI003F3163C2
MDIKEDKELKFIIDKLIEYSNEIDEEIKILTRKKKEVEKVIKSYIVDIQDTEEKQVLEICYESDYFHTYLNRKIRGKELYKIKKDNLQELIKKQDYHSIEIKSSVQLIRRLIKNIEECKYEWEKLKAEEILAKYLNYINRTREENKKNELDKDKIELIKHFINSSGNEINYLKIKKYFNNTYLPLNKDIKESNYKIKLIKKNID